MKDSIEREYEMQSNLNKEQLDAQQAGNASMMLQNQQETQAVLIEQLSPDKIIENIKLILEGSIRDEYGEIKKIGDPLMNQKGVNNLMISIRSVVNINTIMSAIREEKINEFMIDLMDEIIDDLTLNWKEYDIKNKSNLDKIEGIIKRMAYPAFMRSKEGGERIFLKGVTVENISSRPTFQPMKKEGFFERFKL